MRNGDSRRVRDSMTFGDLKEIAGNLVEIAREVKEVVGDLVTLLAMSDE